MHRSLRSTGDHNNKQLLILHFFLLYFLSFLEALPSESHSVLSDSLRPHGLCSPWNSPGQNTGMSSLSLLQGIFPTQGSNPGLPPCRQILYQLSHKKTQEYWSGQPIPSPADLPDPGIETGSPALQVDSLAADHIYQSFVFSLLCFLHVPPPFVY